MPSTYRTLYSKVHEIDARQRSLQPCPNDNNTVITQQLGIVAKRNMELLTGRNNGHTPPTLMSLPRELRDLIIDEVLRAPITPPSTEREPPNGPFQTINTIPRLMHTHSALRTSHVNAQLRAETDQCLRKLRCPLHLDIIVYEDGDTKCTWTNVPAYWRQNGNFSLEITVRFQRTHLHMQHEYLRFSVTDMVRKAALAIIFDGNFLEWREESNIDRSMWTIARRLSYGTYRPAPHLSYSSPNRALEQINVVLVTSAEHRTEDVIAPLVTAKRNGKDVSKICQSNNDNFDFLATLMRGHMESTFFDVMGERGLDSYRWRWSSYYRPFITHVRELNLFGADLEHNSWEIGHVLRRQILPYLQPGGAGKLQDILRTREDNEWDTATEASAVPQTDALTDRPEGPRSMSHFQGDVKD